MLILWKNKLIRFRAGIIKNMLAMICITVMFSACGGGGSENDNNVNEDSLKQAREQQRLDSIARADSLDAVEKDSAGLNMNADPNYKEEQYPVGKYGGPVPDEIK
ncbi:MAG: hypothetical protein C0592_00335 [Marinilabiliales bacterium]|nr:MAG: hypothetical protein C0592_00335 [Marinilabiliales bacterium]